MRINEVTYGKLKTLLKVNGKLKTGGLSRSLLTNAALPVLSSSVVFYMGI